MLVLEREKMKISILGSGSSGNSTYIETENKKILVDAGFSGKKMEEKLKIINVDISTIDAILITHEHTDHILGAGILSRKYNIPLYITQESYDEGKEKLGKICESKLVFIENEFYIDQVRIIPFDVMHDAVRTIGFCIKNSKEKKLAIATDIGYATNVVQEHFKGADVVVIESNYDYHKLMQGPYPWHLKNRVKGKMGHLCNTKTSEFVKNIYSERLKKVYLTHISKDNNTYDLAYETIKSYLIKNQITLDIEVATQENVTQLFCF